MEIEAEHYTNGVVESSSARIMNGTYKHEEILQPDDNSIGNGVTGAHTFSPFTDSSLWVWAFSYVHILTRLSVLLLQMRVAVTAGSFVV